MKHPLGYQKQCVSSSRIPGAVCLSSSRVPGAVCLSSSRVPEAVCLFPVHVAPVRGSATCLVD